MATMQVAAETRTIAELLDEIQRLTRYQGRVEFSTKYFVNHTPANSEHPMAVFRGGDDDETDMPYYAALPEYGFLEGIGRTWQEALASVVDALKAQESDR